MRIQIFASIGVALLLAAAPNTLAANSSRKLCATTVGILVTEFEYRIPNTRLERVEIRQCEPGFAESIQIAAWSRGDSDPALVIDTASDSVVQTAASGSVFLIETGSATTDRVFVITFKAGKPRLALKRNTKGHAAVVISDSNLSVSIPDYWQNNVKRFSFVTR